MKQFQINEDNKLDGEFVLGKAYNCNELGEGTTVIDTIMFSTLFEDNVAYIPSVVIGYSI